jgi:hypothetical protein
MPDLHTMKFSPKFPIHFSFRILTLQNDFTATDADGKIVAYVKQKLFKLKEDVEVFSDLEKTSLLYRIKADRWIDYSAVYTVTDNNGLPVCKIARKGWRSLWRASYHILSEEGQELYSITEKSAWVKVMDGLFGEIPILGIFSGYVFHPAYQVKNKEGICILELKKRPSFWGKEFSLNLQQTITEKDEAKILPSVMMMILLERTRG